MDKYEIIELRKTIRELKERNIISDIEILKYVYKTLGYYLNK